MYQNSTIPSTPQDKFQVDFLVDQNPPSCLPITLSPKIDIMLYKTSLSLFTFLKQE
jgi:hypothetical protein